ncbi:branched-chain amino acid ABC transporter permease [Pusillimonas noertemannii]|uniref:Branched-chain amino acid transport system permease protein n=1 Tax=Pusillimonas noertemannii TaxID=305977 RepID=A0A2U1CK01_9BURK|nr:branched-chain amino acid ABC transporter permease [Pusillimonas noertemannii]NYT69761.1 branched-chain amino acid ABC transporter permease [Pusillimonas noertemannii]PVY61315.1 branched-chain amino acid transport system permease protein [Pusillimonas noertemannii]TFL09275.1 branched-chain amino acid ABC transporter permease [Pusillimonas noertemannii]
MGFKLFQTIFALLFNGIAYGMILFIISAGLSVTMGTMRVVNLAHCGFAMVGGYIAYALMDRLGLSFSLAIPAAFVLTCLLGAVLEYLLYRGIYRQTELKQVIMTLGLALVMIASVNLLFGASVYNLNVPSTLSGNVEVFGVGLSVYRIFLILVSSIVGLLIWYFVERTYLGKKLKAAVDNPGMARCVGINVDVLFSGMFAVGCGLAALGGALGAELMPLQPFYALKYLVIAVIVVSIGGLGSIKGTLLAALALGVVDTFGTYFFSDIGAFLIYFIMILVLFIRPQGLFGRRA